MNSKIIVHKLSNTNISLSYKKLEKYYEDNIKRVNYNHKFTLTCKTKDSKPNIICIEYILRESDIIKLKDFLKKEIFSDNDIIKQEDSKDSKDLIKKKIFTPLSENKFDTNNKSNASIYFLSYINIWNKDLLFLYQLFLDFLLQLIVLYLSIIY